MLLEPGAIRGWIVDDIAAVAAVIIRRKWMHFPFAGVCKFHHRVPAVNPVPRGREKGGAHFGLNFQIGQDISDRRRTLISGEFTFDSASARKFPNRKTDL